MSFQITNLKKLIYSRISGSERIIVTDVTSSGKIETKAIELNELKHFYVTSSNINNTFKTGSYYGDFYGIFSGSVDSSSYSITSSKSLITNNLVYSISNGTASYSINSLSSSKSKQSDYSLSSSFSNFSNYSVTSSHVFINEKINLTNTSNKSDSSISSSISQKTTFIIPSNNNGIVRRSIHSERSVKAEIAEGLSPKNTTKMLYAYESEESLNSLTASVSKFSSYANSSFRSSTVFANTDAFAYCSFTIKNNTVVPICWYNVSKISFIKTPRDFGGRQFIISYNNPPSRNQKLFVKADSSPLITTGGNYDAKSIANIKNNSACWALNCSRTSALIYVQSFIYGKTSWQGGWWEEKRYLKADEIRLDVSNIIFSFAAVTIDFNISGSNNEDPPTTNPSNC